MRKIFLTLTLVSIIVLSMIASVSASHPVNPVAEATAADPIAQFAAITDSEKLSSVSAASGQVIGVDGKKPVSNAQVFLFAWPNSDAMAKLADGDRFERIPLGKSSSDEYGYYQIRIDPAVDFSMCWSQSGSMDCELVTLTDDGFSSVSFSILKAEQNLETAKMSDDSAYLNAELQDIIQGAKLNITLMPKSDETPEMILGAGEYLIETYPAQWVNVGNILIANFGYTEQFVYTAGATSAIGVGISTTGNYGTYSAGGTVSRSSTCTVSFPVYSAPTTRFMDTMYVFKKYRCYFGIWYYCVRAEDFAGGTRTSRICYYPTDGNFRTPYEPGSVAVIDQGVASTWEDGAKVSYLIGINLSSRCGYASNAKMIFNFTAGGWLYGETNYPPFSNGRVWVKSS